MSYHDMACYKNKVRTQVREYLLSLSTITSEVSFFATVKARCARFALLTTMLASLAFGRISLLRRKPKILILSALIFLALRPNGL